MKKILIHNEDREIIGVLMINDKVVEIYIERKEQNMQVGNIYRGRVVNILPGMQSAFIDIGEEKNAFLFVGDLLFNTNDLNIEDNKIEVTLTKDKLTIGEEILVQVIKEPFGTKGPRVTSQISLPGRFLVYLPSTSFIGISRKITDENEKKRLKELLKESLSEKEGVIIRTLANGVNEELLKEDLNNLRRKWQEINQKIKKTPIPGLVYQDLSLIYRMIRDLFSDDVEEMIVDHLEVYQETIRFVAEINSSFTNRVKLHFDKTPLFAKYRIAEQIEKALRKKVWLNSGGYLIIEQTEALTVIDVNTGKFVGKNNLEDTVVKTNIEAAKEIAFQLRLRDIGGIIIIDFIDMKEEANREKVLETLKTELNYDRTKTNVLGFTQLGLIEMTRKKMRQPIIDTLLRPCPYCHGTGKILSEIEIAVRIEKELKEHATTYNCNKIKLEAHPDVLEVFLGKNQEHLKRLEKETSVKIEVVENKKLFFEDYHLTLT